MSNIDNIINLYKSEFYLLFDRYDLGIKIDIAREYLQKYLLDKEEYLTKWRKIENNIFQNQNIGLPNKIFRNNYSLLLGRGGILFDEKDFKILQDCILKLGDKNLVIIQNDFGGIINEPLLRMKYPADISWKEMIRGSFISTILINMTANEYFVYSESGLWGKYSANEYDFPLDIIGFRSEVASSFEKYKLFLLEDDITDIECWIPEEYK